MKPRILVGLGLIVLLLVSVIFLTRDLAIGQNSGEGSPASDSQDKLDQILANQDKIMDRLNALSDLLSHEIKVRCTS